MKWAHSLTQLIVGAEVDGRGEDQVVTLPSRGRIAPSSRERLNQSSRKPGNLTCV